MRKLLLLVGVVSLALGAVACGNNEPAEITPRATAGDPAATGGQGQAGPATPGQRRCEQLAGENNVYQVGEAGQVELRHEGDTLDLVEVRPAEGWSHSVDDRDDRDEVEVTFSREGREIEFEAEIDDGRLDVEICD